MEEINRIYTYQEFKHQVDEEIQKQALGFIKIGYLLKIARDTEILSESGYKNVSEFAKAEYNLTKDVVSRYIAINDRYSENGYSEKIALEYKDYGVAKLAEMLTMSDEVVKSLSPMLTKAEIKEIKAEIQEEQKKTDIEVILEDQVAEQKEMTLIEKTMNQVFKENHEMFIEISEEIHDKPLHEQIEIVLDAMAPSGIAVIMVRLQGIGKMMISIKGKEQAVEILNVRTNEKEMLAWQQMVFEVKKACPEGGQKAWEAIYQEPYPEKVTPVQSKTEQKPVNTQSNKPKQEERKTPRVITPKKEVPKEEPKEQPKQEPEEEKPEVAPVQQETEDEQLPGQMEVKDYPEIQPETKKSSTQVAGLKSDLKISFSNLAMEIERSAWEAAEVSAKNVLSYIKSINALSYIQSIKEEENA